MFCSENYLGDWITHTVPKNHRIIGINLRGVKTDVDAFKNAYKEDVFENKARTPATCSNTLEQELAAHFNVAANELDASIKAACTEAQKAKPEM